jgi:cytidyltransferase-like protein
MASYILAGSLIVAVTILVVVAILVKPILFPTVILFPWRDDETKKRNQTVILAGSYNPPHLGHLAMLRYLSQRYEKVIAVVGFNPNKKYPVSPDQRKKLLELMMQSTDSTNVEVAGKKVENILIILKIWMSNKRCFADR